MKKVVLLMLFTCILFSGCFHDNNSDKDESLDAFIDQFKKANVIQYHSINKETLRHDVLDERTSVANINLTRKPYHFRTVAIVESKDGAMFFQRSIKPSADHFLFSYCLESIEEADYKIDADGNINLEPSVEQSIRLKTETMENTPSAVTQMTDFFQLLIFLVEKNADSFQIDDSGKNDAEITYRGYIQPDTIVDYYRNDGKDAFQEMLYIGYQGEMTREALGEALLTNMFIGLGSLNGLLFAEKPIPFTFAKNREENTYHIIIDLIDAQGEYYAAMLAEMPEANVTLEESVIELNNIVLQ